MSDRESLRVRSRAGARCSRTSRAGLKFPVGRIHRFLRKGNYGRRFSADAPVYLASVMEYMTKEVLFVAGLQAQLWKHHRIIPRHLQMAMHAGEELDKVLKNVIMPQGGNVPKLYIVPTRYAQIEILPPTDL